jgi:hypothetical protein
MLEKFETCAPVMALFLPYMKCTVFEFIASPVGATGAGFRLKAMLVAMVQMKLGNCL